MAVGCHDRLRRAARQPPSGAREDDVAAQRRRVVAATTGPQPRVRAGLHRACRCAMTSSEAGNGDLVVSGGGSSAVEVDELFVHAAKLAATAAIMADWLDRLDRISRGLETVDLDGPSGYGAAGSPRASLSFARICLGNAQRLARALPSSLLEAAERYGDAERRVEALWQLGAFLGAPWLDAFAP